MKRILILLFTLYAASFGYDYNRDTEEIVIEKLGMSRKEIPARAKAIERDRGWVLIELELGKTVWYGVFKRKK